MLTLRLSDDDRKPEHYKQILQAIQAYPGCCDEIWIPTLFGFPKLEKHRQAADEWKSAIDYFKKAGLRVCLQLSNTIGHGEYAKSSDCSGLNDNAAVGHLVGAEGEEAGYCYCWSNPAFQTYSQQVVELYAGLDVDTIWIDDDLRPTLHTPVMYGCFCPECIKSFQQETHTNYSRQELVEAIQKNATGIRQQWMAFVRQKLAAYTKMLSSTAARKHPGIQIGYQYVSVNQYTGAGEEYLFEAMEKGSARPPRSRPGYGFYEDVHPVGMVEKAYRIAYCNQFTPSYVIDRCAEVENIPAFAFGKTDFGTLTEATLYMGAGCTGLTFASLTSRNEKMVRHETLLKGFQEYRPLWNEIKCAFEATFPCGLGIPISKSSVLSNVKDDFEWARHCWTDSFRPALYGLPICFDTDHTQAILLTEKIAESLPSHTIRTLMNRPVLCETAALARLIERGFDLGLSLTEIVSPLTSEFISNHPINGMYAGMPYCPFGVALSKRRAITSQLPIESLSEYWEGDRLIGTACALVTMKSGARWAILGSGLETANISTAKWHQILQVTDAITGCTMPIRVKTAEHLFIQPRVDCEGRFSCAVILHSAIGPSEKEIRILIRKPAGKSLFYMDHRRSVPTLLVTLEKNEEVEICLPQMDGWDTCFIFAR